MRHVEDPTQVSGQNQKNRVPRNENRGITDPDKTPRNGVSQKCVSAGVRCGGSGCRPRGAHQQRDAVKDAERL